MTKPQPFLNDMPWNVKQKIADEVDTETKLSLSLCSKEYKKYVDSAKTIYDKLKFEMSCDPEGNPSILIHLIPFLGTRGPQFQFSPKGGSRKKTEKAKWEKLVTEGGDYIDGALLQLMKIVKNPKCVVEDFELRPPNTTLVRDPVMVERVNEMKREFLSRFDEHLNRLNHKLKVTRLIIRFGGTQEDLEKVIRHLEPGTLEKIFVFRSPGRFSPRNLELDRISETEQWKQAKMILMNTYKIDLPMSKWSHFQSTNIRLGTISLEYLKDIIETMKQSSKWEECRLYGDFNVEDFQRYIQKFPIIQPDVPKFFNLRSDSAERRLATLNSGKTLSISMSSSRISINKN